MHSGVSVRCSSSLGGVDRWSNRRLNARGRLVALKALLPSSCAFCINRRCLHRHIRPRSFVVPAHLLQHVQSAHDDAGLADDDDVLVLQALQADGHPLPGGADHVGEIGVGEGRADQDAVGILDAIELDEVQQQMRRAAR